MSKSISFGVKICSRKVHKSFIVMASLLLIITALCAISSSMANGTGPKVTDKVRTNSTK